MRVMVHPDAAAHYIRRCYKGMRPDCPRMHRPEWADMLRKIQGQWVTVETEHLFNDQFNTAPIPGVSELGMRLMLADVCDIEDDVRQNVIKCNWCGDYDHNHDGACDKCGKSDYLHPLNPLYPAPLRTPNPLNKPA